MDGNGNDIPGAGPLVELDESVGVEILGLPEGDDILVAELRRVAIGLDVVLIGAVALDVHISAIPVIYAGDGARAPVHEDAELCVAEPAGTVVLLQ